MTAVLVSSTLCDIHPCLEGLKVKMSEVNIIPASGVNEIRNAHDEA